MEYVAPEQAVPSGKAPKMQVELISRGEPTKQLGGGDIRGLAFRHHGIAWQVAVVSSTMCSFTAPLARL
jgi:hypothetical protein